MYSNQLLICDGLKKKIKYKYNMTENFDINTIKDKETGKTHICKQIPKTKVYMNDEVVFDLLDNDKNSEYKTFFYKRMNHFNEYLHKFQGKVPQEVLDKLIIEIKKDKINNLELLTPVKIKEYLKK